jgi:heat shock protein HtpX
MNRLKTAFFLTCLTLLMVAMGSAIGGKSGAIIASVLAGAMNFFTCWYSDRIVLGMYGVREVTEAEAPGLVGMARRLASMAATPALAAGGRS